MQIECIICGNSTILRRNSDTKKYDGQVFCQKCTSLIHVKLAESKIVEYKILDKLSKKLFPPMTADDLELATRRLEQAKQEEQQLIKEYGEKQQP